MLPEMNIVPPGPESRRLARELSRSEGPAVSSLSTGRVPIVWAEARGANVTDVDGNVYLDLTAGFGVANLGHSHSRVMQAVRTQSRALAHGLGDVHPNNLRVELVSRLARVAPGTGNKAVLLNTGAEAVEFALKTALLYTGRAGILAFEGGFHGQSYGALAVTHRDEFRRPFRHQVFQGVARAPFPCSYRRPRGQSPEAHALACLTAVDRLLESPPPGVGSIGALIVEPVQGREGEIVPPSLFLPGLQEICSRRGVVFILDELLTGFCRTGKLFAAEHWGLEPDLLCIGKGLANGLPISGCIGRGEVMDAWRYDDGEAPHSSTFMGNPISAAASLAALDEQERLKLSRRASRMGAYVLEKLKRIKQAHPIIGDVRGLGMMLGIEMVSNSRTKRPAAKQAKRIEEAALRRGLILLAGGSSGNVLAITPPLNISRPEMDHALNTLDLCFTEIEGC